MPTQLDPGASALAAITLIDEFMTALKEKGLFTDVDRTRIIMGAISRLKTHVQGPEAVEVLHTFYPQARGIPVPPTRG